jgi:hypothetical protein
MDWPKVLLRITPPWDTHNSRIPQLSDVLMRLNVLESGGVYSNLRTHENYTLNHAFRSFYQEIELTELEKVIYNVES